MRPFRRLTVELRRNDLRWLTIVFAVATALALSDRIGDGVVFWARSSVTWRSSLYVLGPWVGAVAAWMAGRERRSGLDDLLATTARPPLLRRLPILIATIVLGVAAYAVVGVYVASMTAVRNDWHGPYWGPILVGLSAIPAFAALGFAWGTWNPRRATAFAAMLVFGLIQLIVGDKRGWSAYLTPVPRTASSAWTGVSPDLPGRQIVFFIGVTALALALTARCSGSSRRVRGAMIASALTTILAVVSIVDAVPGEAALAATTSAGFAAAGLTDPGAPRAGTYTPVCTGAPIRVCVHPAFRPILATAAEQVNAVLAPIAGLAGVPETVNLVPAIDPDSTADGYAYPIGGADPDADLARALFDLGTFAVTGHHHHALTDPEQARQDALHPVVGSDQVQAVVIGTLLRSGGRPLDCRTNAMTYSWTGGKLSQAPVPCDALDRFRLLDAVSRHVWLRENWDRLRSMQATLEELP